MSPTFGSFSDDLFYVPPNTAVRGGNLVASQALIENLADSKTKLFMNFYCNEWGNTLSALKDIELNANAMNLEKIKGIKSNLNSLQSKLISLLNTDTYQTVHKSKAKTIVRRVFVIKGEKLKTYLTITKDLEKNMRAMFNRIEDCSKFINRAETRAKTIKDGKDRAEKIRARAVGLQACLRALAPLLYNHQGAWEPTNPESKSSAKK